MKELLSSTCICILAIAISAHAIPVNISTFIAEIDLRGTITTIATSYGFDDNDPPSAQIAYPKSDGYPTKHNLATEGQGTYNDPITFATDKRELPIGTRIYLPYLRKYFIMEDDCEQAHSDWDKGKYHVDLWMGPQQSSDQQALYACEDKITRSAVGAIVDPPQDLPVDVTPFFTNNKCTARIHD